MQAQTHESTLEHTQNTAREPEQRETRRSPGDRGLQVETRADNKQLLGKPNCVNPKGSEVSMRFALSPPCRDFSAQRYLDFFYVAPGRTGEATLDRQRDRPDAWAMEAGRIERETHVER